MNKYQVAIIGTNIGAKHYEDFQKVADKFNVHTVCGLTKESIENDNRFNRHFNDRGVLICHIENFILEGDNS